MEENNTTIIEAAETHSEVHSWPHIPKIQWESVYGFITNTTITIIIFFFMILFVSILGNRALKKQKKSKLKTFFLNFLGFFDKYIIDSFWDKKFARKYFPVIVGLFFIIFFWNIFWLLIDWVGASISPTILEYLRPMHSDLNTTLVLALITIILFLVIWIKTNGVFQTTKWYLFNFTWNSFWEKCINVFVWWLHLLSVPASIASLSLRLFWNIFAWVVLIWVILFLWGYMSEGLFEVGKFLSIPFWFFEVFVAFIQSVVFVWLTIAYFKQATEKHH